MCWCVSAHQPKFDSDEKSFLLLHVISSDYVAEKILVIKWRPNVPWAYKNTDETPVCVCAWMVGSMWAYLSCCHRQSSSAQFFLHIETYTDNRSSLYRKGVRTDESKFGCIAYIILTINACFIYFINKTYENILLTPASTIYRRPALVTCKLMDLTTLTE